MTCTGPSSVRASSGWEVLKSISGAHDGEVKVPVFLVSAQDAVNRLPESEFLFVTQNRGLTLNSVVRCLQGLPSLLSESQEVLGRAPV